MSIRNILCAYSGEEANLSGLKHAIKLANHHKGWLTGVLRHGRPVLERRYASRLPDEIIEHLHAADATRVREVSDRFNRVIAHAGLSERCDFIDLDPETDGSISELARNFDLVVTGVHSDSLDDSHMSANPDLIALRSGRPVLVVPNDYEAEGLADHALVAWDGKRSAARALGDAMPILEKKAKVTILTVGNHPSHDKDILIRSLKRHGIQAEYRVEPRKGSVAKTIFEVADQVSAKLLVMGAFEHSKFAHKIIGGATTDVMIQSAIPVFLSH